MEKDGNIEERVEKPLFVNFRRKCKYQGSSFGHIECRYWLEHKPRDGGYYFQGCYKSCCPLKKRVRQ